LRDKRKICIYTNCPQVAEAKIKIVGGAAIPTGVLPGNCIKMGANISKSVKSRNNIQINKFMRKKLIITFAALCITLASFASFNFTASCGAQTQTDFGNLSPEQYQSYLLELDDILCS
jgi:uncharacterized membrane protein YoaK (UPF0700 family)